VRVILGCASRQCSFGLVLSERHDDRGEQGSLTTSFSCALVVAVIVAVTGSGRAASATASQKSEHPRPIVAQVPARSGVHGTRNGPSPAAAEHRSRGYLVRDRDKFAAAKKGGAKRLLHFAAAGGPLIPSSPLGWEGLSDPNTAPSDSIGAIGPDRYVELVNDKFGIYNRIGNTIAAGSLPIASYGIPPMRHSRERQLNSTRSMLGSLRLSLQSTRPEVEQLPSGHSAPLRAGQAAGFAGTS
jgi:hypothetical protein